MKSCLIFIPFKYVNRHKYNGEVATMYMLAGVPSIEYFLAASTLLIEVYSHLAIAE